MIEYIERKTAQKCIEKIYGHKTLSLLYGDGPFQVLFSKTLLPLIAQIPFFSYFYGYLQKLPSSAKKVESFIEAYGIDKSEFLTSDFTSFNDFFIRKLKPEVRPIVSDPNRLAMPADGRYLVFSKFHQFQIKGKTFSLREFLENQALSNHYAEGSIAIVRLCPSDYHRFHFPCDGTPSKARLINGPLYSVNPMALRKKVSILSENKRMITEIETKNFGLILYVEIGATAVGSIHQTYLPEELVRKGSEKGYFEFGGSCIVLLFEKGTIEFDSDLLKNSEQGYETRANYGDSLAKSLL